METRSVRGAITLSADNADEVVERSKLLLSEMLDRNGLEIEDVISIFFTATADIKSKAPAAGARELGITDAGLLCAQEMDVPGGPEKCVRTFMHVRSDAPQAQMTHVFLGGATSLRPDLAQPGDEDR